MFQRQIIESDRQGRRQPAPPQHDNVLQVKRDEQIATPLFNKPLGSAIAEDFEDGQSIRDETAGAGQQLVRLTGLGIAQDDKGRSNP